MVAPNLPDLYRVAINGQLGTLPMTNVVYVFLGGETAASIAAMVENDWPGAWNAVQSEDFEYTSVEAREMVPTGMAVSVGSSEVGQITSQSVPPGTALCVTWSTLLGGRSHRGRSYIPGITVGQIDSTSSQWANSGNDLQDAANQWLTNASNDGLVPVVYSALHQSYQAITSGTIKTQIASQRRRNVP